MTDPKPENQLPAQTDGADAALPKEPAAPVPLSK
jgi:hypothetical protein